jgi:hypothetical protein
MDKIICDFMNTFSFLKAFQGAVGVLLIVKKGTA